MDTTKTITHIGLCAGYGGIELGLKRVLPNLRSVAICEIEAFACANLVAKMEAGLMEPAPIWTDLKTFPWAEFSGRVDVLTGGYPCQPFSAAGKRLGTEDPRHLWPYIASGIRILRPRLCFFENVEGHISLGLCEVIGELEQIGYKVSWGIFSASEVGAPHQRKRVFILAYDKSLGIQGCGAGWLQEPRSYAGQALPLRGGDAGVGELANAELHGRDYANARPHTDGIQGPLGQWHEHRQAIGDGQVWPSRPGEPQHAWEPPRVVTGSMANTNGNEQSEGRRDDGKVLKIQTDKREENGSVISGRTSECRGIDKQAMGNAAEQGLQVSGGQRSSMGEPRPQPELERPDQSVGNAECLCISTSREHGAMEQESGIPADRKGSELTQTDSIAGASRKREGHGSNASERSETQPALGRDADGPARGLGYAELCVSCDNRTDELRLLGNGVVPATAERAFRTLLEELNI